MYLLLETISEFLDRFSLVMVGGLIGIVGIFLVWSKMPKSDRALREAKIETKRIARMDRKVKRLRRKFDPARKHIPGPDLVELIIIASVVLLVVTLLLLSSFTRS